MRLLEKISLTILVDNRRASESLELEHGFSCLVEADGCRVLFDTGARDALITNSRRLGVSLGALDAVVFSHGHYDHTGGLAAIADQIRQVQVCAHPGFLGPHHSRRTGSDRDIGVPDASRHVLAGLRLRTSLAPIEVCPGVWTTGEIPRVTQSTSNETLYTDAEGKVPDPLRDDMALVIRHRAGLVLLLGCAHAGVIDTMRHVEQLFPGESLLGVLGGMHLDGAESGIVQAVTAVLEASSARFIAPGHCTGDTSIQALESSIGSRVFSLRAGLELLIDGPDGQLSVRERAARLELAREI
jgi:7,8-dihydropterin-6-yl-methyl-4-(beta-D-ribofuranosyl)aminobenzene 5'-phosphate synthase